MAKVIFNQPLSQDYHLLQVAQENSAAMGQFYMLRSWETYPLLSRPISVFDTDGKTLTFLFQVVGQGTRLLSTLRPGDSLTLHGPYGNTFPRVSGAVAMVGGGVGIAPLHLAAKTLQTAGVATPLDLYLGFREEPLLLEPYRAVCDSLTVDIGGFITDKIQPADYDIIFTCGPAPMMQALYDRCRSAGVADRLFVSMENRMACGIGACLVCSCKTQSGNKKVCKDGPVFPAEEVFGL